MTFVASLSYSWILFGFIYVYCLLLLYNFFTFFFLNSLTHTLYFCLCHILSVKIASRSLLYSFFGHTNGNNAMKTRAHCGKKINTRNISYWNRRWSGDIIELEDKLAIWIIQNSICKHVTLSHIQSYTLQMLYTHVIRQISTAKKNNYTPLIQQEWTKEWKKYYSYLYKIP